MTERIRRLLVVLPRSRRRALRIAILVAVCAFAALGVDAAKPKRQTVKAVPAPAVVSRPMPFSSGPLGATAPAGWSVRPVPKVERKTVYDLIDDNGRIVLRARAKNSAASLRHSVYADPARTPVLRWRWRIERVLSTADMNTKDGDDYAARLYVFFDRDPEKMSLKERTLLKVARARFGDDLPAAALCYVWDNRQPVDTIQPNAYTDFVMMVVASSGERDIGSWLSLQRNVADDYRRAFGAEPPQITGVAVAVDTDNTHEAATTYFGDIEFVGGRLR